MNDLNEKHIAVTLMKGHLKGFFFSIKIAKLKIIYKY